MASQVATPTSSPGAHVIGNAFVEQYYPILHQSPEVVYKFYQDSSILGRPDLNGVMTSVTTMQAINEKILSLNYKNYKAEIKTIDAQHSHEEGVIVLVTGCLTGMDNIRRKFTQSFFLAPQEKGCYFVLNDVFRYVEGSQAEGINHVLVNGAVDHTPSAPVTPDPEPSMVEGHHLLDSATHSEDDQKNGVDIYNVFENGGSVVEEEEEVPVSPPVNPCQNELPSVPETTAIVVEEDAPKKSYASILKVMKGSTAPATVYMPTSKAKVPPVYAEKQASASTPAPVAEAPAPNSNNVPESGNPSEEVEGHSVYVRNLPLNATPAQLEEQFKNFGTIKPGGVQVRNHKQHGYCFGFVEFESSSSMHSAIEASPVSIAGRNAVVEEKKTTTRVGGAGGSSGGGRGRFPPARGGFRNDSFNRGRGGFGGGQGYGRSEFRNRSDFSSRGRGPPGRGSEGYQRVDQNGARISHLNNPTAVSA